MPLNLKEIPTLLGTGAALFIVTFVVIIVLALVYLVPSLVIAGSLQLNRILGIVITMLMSAGCLYIILNFKLLLMKLYKLLEKAGVQSS
jgi:hypothetical protein